MKVTFVFDDGTEVTTKPENLVINNTKAGDTPVVVVGYKTGQQLVPALTFIGHYFSVDALKEHNALQVKATLEAVTRANQKMDAPTADATPAAHPTPSVRKLKAAKAAPVAPAETK